MKTKNKLEAGAKRRVRAARLLQSGKKPAEVAKLVGAPRQTVYRWLGVLESEGIEALRDMSKGGRPARLGAEQLARLQVALLEGPPAHGFGTPLWTIKRVRLLIERTFGVRYSPVHVWRLLGQLGFSNQKPERGALERDEAAIDWRLLERELGPVDLAGVRTIGMDEFAIQKGHRYATVVVEPSRKRVLWVGRGRGRDDVRPFFELLGPEGCANLEAVAMDMSAAYEQEVRQRCPLARIVYDLFHVVAKYGREVIDRVRVDEVNRLREDRPARRLVKGARWLLLRNCENVTAAPDQVRLKELLAANRALFTVYALKDDLKALWDYRHIAYAERFWRQWYRRALASGITPLKSFAQRLKPYLPGILAHCRWPLGTNLIEGINNTIKIIKPMAYGYRDDAYFFLRIRAAFPGIR